jgi:hypothetical protein
VGGALGLLLTALVGLLVVALPATAAPSGPPATFGIGPASETRVDGRAYLQFLTSPGARATDHVAIQNFANEPVQITVYAADAVTTRDGSLSFAPRTDVPKDTGAWIRLPGGRPTVTIPARRFVVLPLAVAVPADASPGDHVGAVIASLTSKVVSKSGQRVSLDQRIALRTFFRVAGARRPQLTVKDVHARYLGVADPIAAGTARVTYTVTNTGNVRLGAKQRVRVSGLLGDSTTLLPADIPMLVPGGSATLTVTVPKVLPTFIVTAHIELTPVVFAGDVDGNVAKHYSGSGRFWAVPWTLLALIAALLALYVVVRKLRRRRGTPPSAAASPAAPSPVPAGHT